MLGRLLAWMLWPICHRIAQRQPDFVIGRSSGPYLRRWWVIPRNDWFNIYLHEFLHDDDDRALHDHPWWSVSLLLNGEVIENTPAGSVRFRTGTIKVRSATYSHRIELIDSKPAWTLFITGPKIREWGFHCPKGWIPWTRFCDPNDIGNVGPGCDG